MNKRLQLSLFFLLAISFYLMADCTIGNDSSNSDPFSGAGCNTGVITIDGNLTIDGDYDISGLTGITELVITGTITWGGDFDFILPPNTIFRLDGGTISSNPCNSQRTLNIGGVTIASCNGGGGGTINYDFAEVIAAGGIAADGSLLPINLLSFNATNQTSGITLNWQTATELQNDYMAIERSRDGKNFEELGRRNGIGTSYEVQTYSFFDEKPFPGLNYYRLRQVDFDGTTSYHRVIAVQFGKDREDLFVFPTIAHEQVFINFPTPLQEEASFRLIDVTGKVLLHQKLQANTQSTSLQVDHLVNGHYFLQIQTKNNTQVERFIKN